MAHNVILAMLHHNSNDGYTLNQYGAERKRSSSKFHKVYCTEKRHEDTILNSSHFYKELYLQQCTC